MASSVLSYVASSDDVTLVTSDGVVSWRGELEMVREATNRVEKTSGGTHEGKWWHPAHPHVGSGGTLGQRLV